MYITMRNIGETTAIQTLYTYVCIHVYIDKDFRCENNPHWDTIHIYTCMHAHVSINFQED